MALSKNWYPKFGFSRRNDRAWIELVNSLGKLKLGSEAHELYTMIGGVQEFLSKIVAKKTILTVAEIVGTAAGDIGHAAGAILVPAPGAAFVLEFISAILCYKYDTAAYTGGGDDNVIQNGDGAVALSAVIAGADLLEASGNKIVVITALATDVALAANKPITLKGTALTQPGTAAGICTAYVQYRKLATGF